MMGHGAVHWGERAICIVQVKMQVRMEVQSLMYLSR
jgi:hypothetical protein